jgi:protein-S-isoprenylcysteine O-methyltransferase Ste14
MVVVDVKIRTEEGMVSSVAGWVRSLRGVVDVGEDLASGYVTSRVEAGSLTEVVDGVLNEVKADKRVLEATIVFPDELTRRETSWFSVISYGVYPLLWILPSTPLLFGWSGVDFLLSVPVITVPFPAVASAWGLALLLQLLAFSSNRLRLNEGGCKDSENTAVLITKGPYSVVRHPHTIGGLAVIVLLPVMLSIFIRYTVLSVVGQVLILAVVTGIQVPREEEFSLKKWDGAYETYMREVPRFNIVLGLLRRFKRIRSEKHGEGLTASVDQAV